MDKEKIHIFNGATLYSYIIKPSYQLKRNTDKWNNDLNPAVFFFKCRIFMFCFRIFM